MMTVLMCVGGPIARHHDDLYADRRMSTSTATVELLHIECSWHAMRSTVQPLRVSWVSWHPKNSGRWVSDTPPTFWYLVTCNWSLSSVNLFNTAVTAHQRPIFYLRMHRKRLAAGPAGELTASPNPLASFKRWRPREKERRGGEL